MFQVNFIRSLDRALRDWMMGVFRSTDRFTLLSRTLIRNNLRPVLGRNGLDYQLQNTEAAESNAYFACQRAIERNAAVRTARLHNGGNDGQRNWLAYRANVEELLWAAARIAVALGRASPVAADPFPDRTPNPMSNLRIQKAVACVTVALN